MTQASFCPLMNSRVFKNVLEESNESEANFNLAIAILKFAEDSFDSGRTFLKTREFISGQKEAWVIGKKFWEKADSSEANYFTDSERKYYFFHQERFHSILIWFWSEVMTKKACFWLAMGGGGGLKAREREEAQEDSRTLGKKQLLSNRNFGPIFWVQSWIYCRNFRFLTWRVSLKKNLLGKRPFHSISRIKRIIS